MSLTEQDARALMHLARRIREDTYGCKEWDENGTWAEIKQLVGQQVALTVDRVCRHAADPTARTPGAIRRPFTPDAPTPGARYPAKATEDCESHPGEHRDACRGCAADRLAGEPSPAAARRRPALSTEGAALARQQLHQALTVGAESTEETA